MQDDPQSAQEPADSQFRLSEDLVQDLQLVPGWARQGPGTVQERPFREGRSSSFDTRDRGERRGGKPMRNRRPAERPAAAPARPPVETAPPAPVDVRVLPDSARLSIVARRIRSSNRAYPLGEVAALFVASPESCRVRIESLPTDTPFAMFHCKACGAVATAGEAVLRHLVDTHFADYFEREDTVSDAPAGQFTCVARCGLSGLLLGPPNHHSYAEKVQEVHRTKFPSMPMDRYRNQIEVVRDPELIEKWKEESRRKTIYRRKGAADAAPLKWAEAEALFRDTIAPGLMTRTRRALMPAPVALQIQDAALRPAVANAWRRETRFPKSLLFALRAAFRHMHLHVFKWGDGMDFVTAIAPTPLTTDHVVESIREILRFVPEHPGCHRQAVQEGLAPAMNASDKSQVPSLLEWLIEKGHIIEFSSGALGVPFSAQTSSTPSVAAPPPPSPPASEAASVSPAP